MKSAHRKLALVAVGLLANCSPGHQELVIFGDTPPGAVANGVCTYAAVTTGFLSSGTLDLEWQKAVNAGASQLLHYTVGLTVNNTLSIQPLTTSTGQPLDTLGQEDIQVFQIQATFDTVPAGAASVPDVTVPATGYIPQGADGVAIFDLMSSAASQALVSAAAKPFTLLANITVVGTTGAGSTVYTNPFQFPIAISYSPVPTLSNGDNCGADGEGPNGTNLTSLSFPNGPCGEPQDTASVACNVPDGGL